MANRFGNLYRIGVGIETAYGNGKTNPTSIAFTELTIHSGVIEMNPVVNTATTTFKGLTAQTHPKEETNTTSMGNVVVRGDLTAGEEIYLKALFNSASEYSFADNPNATPISLVLLQIWSDTPSGTSYKVNRAKGAKCVSFNITGSQGGLIQFEATFETKPIEREVTQAITGTDPGIPSPLPFQFADVTASLYFGNTATALETFSISLTNTLTADGVKFANNRTITSPIVISNGGTISYTCNYDSAGVEKDAVAYLNQNEQDILDSISLVIPAVATWKIDACSVATALDVPDTDKDLFKLNYTGKIAYNSTSHFMSATVTVS